MISHDDKVHAQVKVCGLFILIKNILTEKQLQGQLLARLGKHFSK